MFFRNLRDLGFVIYPTDRLEVDFLGDFFPLELTILVIRYFLFLTCFSPPGSSLLRSAVHLEEMVGGRRAHSGDD
jgi:hypothetical protein